jgi:hypothetical protein
VTDLKIKTIFSIHELDSAIWDQLSEGRPFQSHRWYAFGERVMADCQPVYLLAYENDRLIARACLWLVRNEPLPPKLPVFLRTILSAYLKRRPLLICRSPLANASGLILPKDKRREHFLLELTDAALACARKLKASFILFDFLNVTEIEGWPPGFTTTKLPHAGMVMENHWQTMEEYLANGNKKDRQHYKRSLREAEKLGIQLTQLQTVPDVEAALKLIRNVEKKYNSSGIPWMQNLLENIEMINGTWLEAHIGKSLVGCGLILEDNHAQMTTALGLEENSVYVYFSLVYSSLKEAFEKKVHFLRWGSGAYEVKERLGFKLEQDNFVAVLGTNSLTNLISRLAAM